MVDRRINGVANEDKYFTDVSKKLIMRIQDRREKKSILMEDASMKAKSKDHS